MKRTPADPTQALFALLKLLASNKEWLPALAYTPEWARAIAALPADLTSLEASLIVGKMPTPTEADAYVAARIAELDKVLEKIRTERDAYDAHRRATAKKVRAANAAVLQALRSL